VTRRSAEGDRKVKRYLRGDRRKLRQRRLKVKKIENTESALVIAKSNRDSFERCSVSPLSPSLLSV